MASYLYQSYKVSLLDANTAPDLENETTIKAALTGSTYSENQTTQNFMDDVTRYTGSDADDEVLTSTVVGTAGASPTATATWVAANSTFASISLGTGDVDGIVIFDDQGLDSASPLIAFIDVAGSAVTPNGGNITVTWDTTIFTI